MFFKQKGLLPTALFVMGLVIHIIFIGFTLPYTILTIVDIFLEGPILVAMLSTLEFLAGMIGLIWSIPLLIGAFCVSAFPEVRVTKNGIEYRIYKVVSSQILWNEIDDVIDLSKGYKALKISRKGFALVNGLYSNKIYGDIVKSNQPVLLLSPNLENIELLLKEVYAHTKIEPAHSVSASENNMPRAL